MDHEETRRGMAPRPPIRAAVSASRGHWELFQSMCDLIGHEAAGRLFLPAGECEMSDNALAADDALRRLLGGERGTHDHQTDAPADRALGQGPHPR